MPEEVGEAELPLGAGESLPGSNQATSLNPAWLGIRVLRGVCKWVEVCLDDG